jgi:erythromycin esterase
MTPRRPRILAASLAAAAIAAAGLLLARRSPSPAPAAASDTPVAWLSEHAIRLRSISPADQDFSDLAPLRAIIGPARVVALGEETHGDGAAFLTKTRLIEHLHRDLGFDVLAVEADMFACREAWARLRAGAPPRDAAARCLYKVWAESEEVAPLLAYLGREARSARPLELWGFDAKLAGRASKASFTAELGRVVHAADPPLVDEPTWAAAKQLLDTLVADDLHFTRADLDRGHAALTAVRDAVLGPRLEGRLPAEDLDLWRQLARSMVALAEGSANATAGRRNERDEQMAENLIWLATKHLRGRKIVVWTATYHLLRDAPAVETLTPGVSYATTVTMGGALHRALGSELLTIGFTAHDGRWGIAGKPAKDIEPAREGSLEDLLARANLVDAIVDLRGAAWLDEPRLARPLGYTFMRARWARQMDAIVFNRTMTPSTAMAP